MPESIFTAYILSDKDGLFLANDNFEFTLFKSEARFFKSPDRRAKFLKNKFGYIMHKVRVTPNSVTFI